MRDEFSEKKPGDVLLAKDINQLSVHCKRFSRMVPGSFLNVHHGDSNISVSGMPPFVQGPVIVSNRNIGSGDVDDSGLYKVRPRVYNSSTGVWVNLDTEYLMDERALGENAGGFLVDDILVCFWVEQAGIFIPVYAPDILRPCNLDAALVAGGSAAITFLVGEDRDEDGISDTVYDNPQMITASKQIPTDSVVWVIWDRVQGKWILGIPSECEEDQ